MFLSIFVTFYLINISNFAYAKNFLLTFLWIASFLMVFRQMRQKSPDPNELRVANRVWVTCESLVRFAASLNVLPCPRRHHGLCWKDGGPRGSRTIGVCHKTSNFVFLSSDLMTPVAFGVISVTSLSKVLLATTVRFMSGRPLACRLQEEQPRETVSGVESWKEWLNNVVLRVLESGQF